MSSRYVALLSFFSVAAHGAAECPVFTELDETVDPISVFDELRLTDKLGGVDCTTALCISVASWELEEPSTSKSAAAADLLDAIRLSAMQLPAGEPGVTELNGRLAEWQILFAEGDVGTLPTAAWQPAPFTLFEGHVDEINYAKVFEDRCPDALSDCSETFAVATCVYTHAVLQRRVLVELLEANRNATIQYLELLNNRWSAFNSGGRSLFPWELWANGAIQQRKGRQRGFVEPPSYQIALLHPSVAVQGEDQSDGSLKAAIVLELVGWYGWKWGGRNGDKMKRPFGASLITSWDGSNTVGYGAMIHLPKNWSIGATRRSVNGRTETTLLLSVDLGRFLTEEGRLRQNLIDKIEPALEF